MAKRATASATRKTASAVRHLDGCPEGRIETYRSERPNGEHVSVTRCQDCGASVVNVAPDQGDS
jgi:hypothetical protein